MVLSRVDEFSVVCCYEYIHDDVFVSIFVFRTIAEHLFGDNNSNFEKFELANKDLAAPSEYRVKTSSAFCQNYAKVYGLIPKPVCTNAGVLYQRHQTFL